MEVAHQSSMQVLVFKFYPSNPICGPVAGGFYSPLSIVVLHFPVVLGVGWCLNFSLTCSVIGHFPILKLADQPCALWSLLRSIASYKTNSLQLAAAQLQHYRQWWFIAGVLYV